MHTQVRCRTASPTSPEATAAAMSLQSCGAPEALWRHHRLQHLPHRQVEQEQPKPGDSQGGQQAVRLCRARCVPGKVLDDRRQHSGHQAHELGPDADQAGCVQACGAGTLSDWGLGQPCAARDRQPRPRTAVRMHCRARWQRSSGALRCSWSQGYAKVPHRPQSAPTPRPPARMASLTPLWARYAAAHVLLRHTTGSLQSRTGPGASSCIQQMTHRFSSSRP